MDHLKLLEIADEEAMRSTFTFRMGAIIVVRNNILGRGFCKTSSNIPQRLFRTHPRSSKWNAMHAETVALRDVLYHNKDPRGADVIVSGFTASGTRPISCRPCRNCVKVLLEKGLRRAIWRTQNGKWEEAKLIDLDSDEQVCSACDQSIGGWGTNPRGPGRSHR